jgi:bcr-type benzoyl-CoA reductase subunit C
MPRVEDLLTELLNIARHPAQSIKKAMRETDKKAVGCFPYYAPEEIVYAAGFLPVGLWGGQSDIQEADSYLQSFCCSIMRENIELGISGAYDFLSAVILSVACDTVKCICENWKAAVPNIKLIPVSYPQNRRIVAGKDYLISEYQKVREKLSEISGRTVTEDDLSSSINLYEDYRRTMREFTGLVKDYPRTLNAGTRHLIIKASYFTDKGWYVPQLKELIKELKKLPIEKFTGSRVIVTGILMEPEALLEVFVQNDIAVIADDLAQESRHFRTSVSRRKTAMEKLASRFINQQCASLYDGEKLRGKLLIDLVRKHSADGVVVSLLKFCEPEEFDYPVYKKELEEANIPVLYLEIDQKMDSVEPLRTRIQSFAEMLQY